MTAFLPSALRPVSAPLPRWLALALLAACGDASLGAPDAGTTSDALADPLDRPPEDAATVSPDAPSVDTPEAPVDIGGLDGRPAPADLLPPDPLPAHPPRNACGGQVALLEVPGTPCGPCADGLQACVGAEAIACLGATPRNACGGCGPLAAPPGGPCGCAGTWACDPAAGTLRCTDTLGQNACGGCSVLDESPGFLCADGAGRLVCDSPSSTRCQPGAVNPCGGTTPLAWRDASLEGRLPGEPCGPCGRGTVVCEDGATGVADCALPPGTGDVCIRPVPAEGTPCGCGGRWSLDGATLRCTGGAPPNACGGCAPLPAVAFAPAPDAETPDAVFVCAGPDWLLPAPPSQGACLGGDASPTPGSPCGPCVDGVLQCMGAPEPVCQGASALHACGGCGVLPGAPGEPCAQGRVWTCDGQGGIQCEAARDRNRCGGVGSLTLSPGDRCGLCEAGTVLCISREQTACVGDQTALPNGCGGCSALPGRPATACGLCATGTWACVGAEEVRCEGEDLDARFEALVDADGDGWGVAGTETLICPDRLGAGWAVFGGDCDDTDPTVHPTHPDGQCNGIDNNCDGVPDEEGLRWRDADGDGWGDPGVRQCVPPGEIGWVDNDRDCFDADSRARPDQTDYLSQPRADGSFDWNCDGLEEIRWDRFGRCNPSPFCSLAESQGGSAVFSWLTEIPECGTEALFLTGCPLVPGGCGRFFEPRVQSCR